MTHYCGTPNMIKIKAPNIDKIPIPYSRQSKVAQFRCWKSPQTITPFLLPLQFYRKVVLGFLVHLSPCILKAESRTRGREKIDTKERLVSYSHKANTTGIDPTHGVQKT
jgi:hypothetical protein